MMEETDISAEHHDEICRKNCDNHIGFNISKVVAPMVGQSDLPFRLLCRKYGADVCYTEMIFSNLFAESEEYRNETLQTCAEDRPLIVQFCGNDPAILLKAAIYAQPFCDAIDLNLGCPQQRAQEGRYGSYLLDKKEWPLVFETVKTLSNGLTIPVFCKIRLCDKLEDTLEFVRGLQSSGCSAVVVHGRKRGSQKLRRCGAADLAAIRTINDELMIPVISNGNIQVAGDIQICKEETKAAGIMSAEGILHNPSLFSSESGHNLQDVAIEYLNLCEETACPSLDCIRQHLHWMLGKSGHGRTVRYKYPGPFLKHVFLKNAIDTAETIEDFRKIARKCLQNIFV